MEFRMDNYLERWAEMYKPISHCAGSTGKERRFYRIDSFTSIEPFASKLNLVKSPCVAFVTQVDMNVRGNSDAFLLENHRVFFLVKQEGPGSAGGLRDELAATEAKRQGREIAEDCLAYLYYDMRTNRNKDLAGIDFSSATIYSMPRQFNGWWPVELIFAQLSPRKLCVEPEKYHIYNQVCNH